MSQYVDENYVNGLSVEELRRELIEALNLQYGLLSALRDAPELPDPWILCRLDYAANWSEDNPLGKKLQRKHGLDAIPPKSECESGAGVWWRIRQGLLTQRPEEV